MNLDLGRKLGFRLCYLSPGDPEITFGSSVNLYCTLISLLFKFLFASNSISAIFITAIYFSFVKILQSHSLIPFYLLAIYLSCHLSYCNLSFLHFKFQSFTFLLFKFLHFYSSVLYFTAIFPLPFTFTVIYFLLNTNHSTKT